MSKDTTVRIVELLGAVPLPRDILTLLQIQAIDHDERIAVAGERAIDPSAGLSHQLLAYREGSQIRLLVVEPVSFAAIATKLGGLAAKLISEGAKKLLIDALLNWLFPTPSTESILRELLREFEARIGQIIQDAIDDNEFRKLGASLEGLAYELREFLSYKTGSETGFDGVIREALNLFKAYEKFGPRAVGLATIAATLRLSAFRARALTYYCAGDTQGASDLTNRGTDWVTYASTIIQQQLKLGAQATENRVGLVKHERIQVVIGSKLGEDIYDWADCYSFNVDGKLHALRHTRQSANAKGEMDIARRELVARLQREYDENVRIPILATIKEWSDVKGFDERSCE